MALVNARLSDSGSVSVKANASVKDFVSAKDDVGAHELINVKDLVSARGPVTCTIAEWKEHARRWPGARIALLWDEHREPLSITQQGLMDALDEDGMWMVPTDRGVGMLFRTSLPNVQTYQPPVFQFTLAVDIAQPDEKLARFACVACPSMVITYRLMQHLYPDTGWVMYMQLSGMQIKCVIAEAVTDVDLAGDIGFDDVILVNVVRTTSDGGLAGKVDGYRDLFYIPYAGVPRIIFDNVDEIVPVYEDGYARLASMNSIIDTLEGTSRIYVSFVLRGYI